MEAVNKLGWPTTTTVDAVQASALVATTVYVPAGAL